MNLNPLEVLSPHWFEPDTFLSYEWVNPSAFWLALFLPLVYIWRYIESFFVKRNLEIAVTKRDTRSQPISVLRFLPELFFWLFFLLFVVALARPQKTDEKIDQWSEGIDIILALDISRSMELTDFLPNRLESAKNNAIRFVEGRFQDRIGIVIFSGDAIAYAPLTTDYGLLKNLIKDIDFSLIQKPGTAIGTALGISVAHLEKSPAKSKVIILLSDGDSNEGSLDPITAAKIAYAAGIKVYTIGAGKEGRIMVGRDMFGNPIYQENTLDEKTLRQIAEETGGQFFRASDDQALTSIFSLIDKYEKSEIKETRYKNTQDFYHIYLFAGLIFFLIWLFCKSTFLTSAIID